MKKQGYTVCATFWFINQSLIFLSMLWKRFQKSFDSNVVRQMVMHILCLYLSRCSRSHVSVLCICSNELRDLSRLFFFFFCMQPSCKSLVVWGLCFYCYPYYTGTIPGIWMLIFHYISGLNQWKELGPLIVVVLFIDEDHETQIKKINKWTSS